MKYLVLTSFVTINLSAQKGKVIEIHDKKLANSLLADGLIEKYSAKNQSNDELVKQVEDLEKQLNEKDIIIASLNDKIQDLEQEKALILENSELPISSDGTITVDTTNASEETSDNSKDSETPEEESSTNEDEARKDGEKDTKKNKE